MTEQELINQFASLHGDAMSKPPGQAMISQVAEMYEALLVEAKRMKGDNPIVAAARTLDRSQIGRPIGTYGDLATLSGQILSALSG